MSNVKETYILIPSYEPDEELIPLVNKLKEVGFDIILVNDGSGEQFNDIFSKVKDKVIYLEQMPNGGKGKALRYGFMYANLHHEGKKYVITCDGDGQHAVEDIIRVNDKLQETDETVFGVRKFDENTPKRSRNGNFMSRLCRTTITKQYVSDDQCGLRGFPLRYLTELITIKGDHYEYEMNVVCTFQLKALPIFEVPIETIYINNNALSHFSPKLDTYRIQRIIWQYDLLPLFSYMLPFIAFILISVFASNVFNGWWILLLFGLAKVFELYTQFGLLSVIYPTKHIGRRGLNEGLFFSIQTTISAGLFILFGYVCKFYPWAAYFLSTFPLVFTNFPLAYWNYKSKMRILARKGK